MSDLDNSKERVEMRVPLTILKRVDEYQIENGISSRTAAFLELVRIGLGKEKKQEE